MLEGRGGPVSFRLRRPTQVNPPKKNLCGRCRRLACALKLECFRRTCPSNWSTTDRLPSCSIPTRYFDWWTMILASRIPLRRLAQYVALPYAFGGALEILMNEIDRFVDQMDRAFAGDAWHGPSLESLLDGVSAEDASKHPIPDAPSIWA